MLSQSPEIFAFFRSAARNWPAPRAAAPGRPNLPARNGRPGAAGRAPWRAACLHPRNRGFCLTRVIQIANSLDQRVCDA